MRKRILVLTPRFPFPVIGGDRLRIFHLCKALSRSYRLTLLSLCQTREEVSAPWDESVFSEVHRVLLPKWKSYWSSLCAIPTSKPLQLAYYESAEFRQRLLELIPDYDAVLAHLIRTGQYLDGIASEIPVILEMTDAISLNYQRLDDLAIRRGYLSYIYKLEKSRLSRYEKAAIRNPSKTWLVSDIDRNFLGNGDQANMEVIPNGVDINQLLFHEPVDGTAIVFIGNMVSLQNRDACLHFIESILPLVRKSADVTFRIVGNAPPEFLDRIRAYSYVQATGRVENIADHVRDAFCGVCPVRVGAGIQNKVLEYMALGLPCVTSRIGAEGIEGQQGIDFLVYQNNEDAAGKILDLFRDLAKRRDLANAGRKLVAEKYCWDDVYNSVVRSMSDVLNDRCKN